MSGDHLCILLHNTLIAISSRGTRLCCHYFGLGGLNVVSHPIAYINKGQYACFQSFLCPLMRAVPELVQPRCLFTTPTKVGSKARMHSFCCKGRYRASNSSTKGSGLANC